MDSRTLPDKENVESGAQNPKTNRRTSLGRGILKNLNRHEENDTIPVTQLPLRDYQTTQALNQGKSSYRRRVSFAPEVTLHKIELVQPGSNTEQYQPKRRETIAFAPSSSQTSADDAYLMIGDKRKHQSLEEDGLMRYSSDIEMEDDSHVYSSPNKSTKAPNFSIYSDSIDADSENMSITQNFEETDDDNTMDLTKPLGNIQQMIIQKSSNPLNISTQITQKITGNSPRPFGSITSIFGNDAAEEDEDEEQEMEFTQPFNNSESSVSRQAPTASLNETEVEETTMDLTNLTSERTDMVTIHNTKLNRGDDGKNANNEDMEVTMDVTKLVSSDSLPFKQAVETQNGAIITSIMGNTTPLKPLRSHTSINGSPMSSKRKSRHDESISLNLRGRINSLTPKRRRESPNKQQSSSWENTDAFFPLVPNQLGSEEEHKSSFTPLRSSKASNKKSLVGSDLINFALGSMEKAPLAKPHDEEIQEEEEYKPVSLKQFLNDLSIEFFDNLGFNDDLTVTFKEQFNPSELHSMDYLNAKMAIVPWFELYMFSCTELQKNMAELKRLFDNLNEEFSDENPPLVRDYYQSINIQQQKRMGDHLLFMKTLSDKKAEISWLTWRSQLLEELISRLSFNLESLKKESNDLNSTLKEVTDLEKGIDDEIDMIDNELGDWMKQSDVIEASSNEDMVGLRQGLIEALETSLSQEHVLERLELEVQTCSNKTNNLGDLEQNVHQKLEFIEANGRDPRTRLHHLKSSFLVIQAVSGVKLTKLEGTILTIRLCDSFVDLIVDLSNGERGESIRFRSTDDLPKLTQFYLERYFSNLPPLKLNLQVNKVRSIVQSLNWLDGQLYYLGLLSPLRITMGDHLGITVKEINEVEGYKAVIEMKLTEESLFGNLAPDSVTAKIIYGSHELQSISFLNNWKSKALDNSWIQGFEELTLLHY